MAEGKLPYKDFFFAHPPFQLILFSMIYYIFGWQFILFKGVAVVSTIVSAYFLFRLRQEKVLLSITTAIFFLFNSLVFFFGHINFGINLTTMFVVLGFYFGMKEKYILSGIWMAFAAMTGLYAIPVIIVFGLYLYIWKGRWADYTAIFLILFLFANIFLMVFLQPYYLDQVYLYHFVKNGVFQWYYFIPFIVFVAYFIGRNKYLAIGGMIFLAINCVSYPDKIQQFNEFYSFEALDSLASLVDDSDLLFGDYTITTLVALENGVDIVTGPNIDTYPLAIRSLDTTRMRQRILVDPYEYFLMHKITNTTNPLWRLDLFKEPLDERCGTEPIISIKENINEYLVFRC